jgi:competence protein ComEC
MAWLAPQRVARLFPATLAGTCFMLGIALHDRAPVWPGVFWFAAAMFLIAMIGAYTKNASRVLAGCATGAFFLAGLSLAQTTHFCFPYRDIAQFAGHTPRLAFLKLHLPYEPEIRSHTFGDRLKIPPRQVTLADVVEVKTHTGWEKTSGRVLVQIQDVMDELRAGQTVEVLGFLQQPGEAANPGQFDWQAYYRQSRIIASVVVRERGQIAILDAAAPPWVTSFRSQVRAWLGEGFRDEQKLDHSLMQMLLLGDYDPELRDIREQFRATGTGHHLAISGMHVAVAGGFVMLVLRVAGFSMRTSWIAGTIFVCIYGLVALPSPSVLRSVLLFVCASMALLSRRSSPAVQLLFVACIVLLAIHPLDLFDAGFQLSFGTVLALMVLVTPTVNLLLDKREPKRLASEVALLPDIVQAGRWADEKVLAIVVAGVVAWLASMPIVGIHFSQLNPWQVPASILLAPLVCIAIVVGLLKVMLSAVMPEFLSVYLADVSAMSTWAMRASAEQLAKLPAADVSMPQPAWWVAGMCWASMVAAVIRWPLVSLRWAARGSVVVCFGLMLVGPYVGWLSSPGRAQADVLRVTVMSVGAGQVVMIETPGSGASATLIDAGSASLLDLFSNAIRPVLRQAGITRIDRLFISHSNTDHFSAAAEVAAAYGVREVLVPGDFSRDATPEARAMLRKLDALDVPPRTLQAGDVIPLGSQTTLTVVWPDDDARTIENANDRSLVLRLDHNGTSILFPGDIQDRAMLALLAADAPVMSTILIAPHHGSAEASTRDFLQRVNPRWVISSNDRTPSNKQKQFDRLCEDLGVRLLRTHKNGAVVIEVQSDGTARVEPFFEGE